ncbi:nuclear transport factor 2 family protein [Flavobacterium aestivum]|uniref:nuclear transport factor 2 family protein n=1 Tax=Flavobacterium aestivum TaxID=3003257 RepID=UPI002482A134|nr:nuclear transport factor 2 family protein [Flavobacterium aestivum]
MKTLFLSLAVLALVSFDSLRYNELDEKQEINKTLDAWHKAAAEANFNAYFGTLTDDAIYIGTDPTENWDMNAFKAFAKPYFDRGRAWNFTALERHIYFDKSGKLAWFDELLNTQMKICRGSGVLVKIGKEWKIKHYVLSMTVPNDNTNAVVKIKEGIEDVVIKNLQAKK